MSKRSSRFRNRPSRTAAGARPERIQREAAVQTSDADLAKQYHYVIEDLTRVGIIALLLIGTMIALHIFVIK
jgi:hypothetical protein